MLVILSMELERGDGQVEVREWKRVVRRQRDRGKRENWRETFEEKERQ